MDKSTLSAPPPGLIAGISSLVRSSVGLLVSRLELAALELSEVRNHALALLAVCALALLCVWFALAWGTVLVVVLSWAAMGWSIILLLFLAFVAGAAALLWKARSMLREGKLTLPETMNELKHDRDMLL